MELHSPKRAYRPPDGNDPPKRIIHEKELTDRQVDVMELLHRDMGYDFLPMSMISRFDGGSERVLRNQMGELRRPGNNYFYVPEQSENTKDYRNRPQFFGLDTNGYEALRERTLCSETLRPKQSKQFAHDFQINMTRAAIELGVQDDPKATFRRRHQVIARSSFQPPTKSLNPLALHVELSYKGQEVAFDYSTDDLFAVGIAEPTEQGQQYGYRYYMHEAENEKDLRGPLTKRTFLRTVLAIKYVYENELYKKHWGIKSLLTLFTVSSERKLRACLDDVVAEVFPNGCSYIMGQAIPHFHDKNFDEIQNLYATPWKRHGYQDFYLNNPGPQDQRKEASY